MAKNVNKKVKVLPVQTMTAYRGSRDIVPLILNHDDYKVYLEVNTCLLCF